MSENREMQKKEAICALLTKTKETIGWMCSLESILNAAGVDCAAIELDPLFEAAVRFIRNYFQDPDLISWWLTAEPDDFYYYDEDLDDDFEIVSAEDLYEFHEMKRERAGD